MLRGSRRKGCRGNISRSGMNIGNHFKCGRSMSYGILCLKHIALNVIHCFCSGVCWRVL